MKESAPIFEDRIFHAADGFEAFVYPEDACGFTVELIQPHASSWNWPDPPPARVSPTLAVTHLAEVVAGADDPAAAGRRFEELFDVGFEMDGATARVPFRNDCVLRFQPDEPGLRSLVLETTDLDADRRELAAAGTPIETGSASHGKEFRVPAGVAGFEVVVRGCDAA